MTDPRIEYCRRDAEFTYAAVMATKDIKPVEENRLLISLTPAHLLATFKPSTP